MDKRQTYLALWTCINMVIVLQKVKITSFDRENFKISAVGFGETFDLRKHPQGTEVKAITFSNMQFHESEGYAEVFVIIDIWLNLTFVSNIKCDIIFYEWTGINGVNASMYV